MNHYLSIFCVVLLSACSNSGIVFPDFTDTVQGVAPVLSGTPATAVEFSPFSSFATFSAPSGWSTYDANGKLRDVLGSASESPAVVTKMMVLLGSLESRIATVGSTYFDDDGNVKECTAIATGTTITTPFFSSSAPFFTFTDTNTYQCYVANGETKTTLFGRTAAANTANCADPFIYHFMEGSKETSTNTESTETRGDQVTLNQIFKFQFDACSKDLKLIYASSTYYPSAAFSESANKVFSSRTELTGNTGTHSFQMRTLKYDRFGNDTFNWFTSKGAGIVLADSGNSYFIINYVGYDGSLDTSSESETFCVRTSTTQGDYAAVAGSNCTNNISASEAEFDSITDLTSAHIHNQPGTSPFSVEASAFGF